jgi:hypothetical protein
VFVKGEERLRGEEKEKREYYSPFLPNKIKSKELPLLPRELAITCIEW